MNERMGGKKEGKEKKGLGGKGGKGERKKDEDLEDGGEPVGDGVSVGREAGYRCLPCCVRQCTP